MKPLIVVAASLVWICGVNAGIAQTTASAADSTVHRWWNNRYPAERLNSPNAQKLPLISVKGNKLVDPRGNTVLFRGLAIADPDKIEHERHWNQDLFQHVQQMGAPVVRIAVHPIAWRERGSQSLFGSARPGGGVFDRARHVCGHRLALNWQSGDGTIPGPDVPDFAS